MLQKKLVVILALAAVISGCANLDNSIRQRVAVSEQCRIATGKLPFKWGDYGALASIQVGNIGKCDLGQDETLLPMCSLNQITTKFGLARLDADTIHLMPSKKQAKPFIEAVQRLRTALRTLASQVGGLDQDYKAALDSLRSTNYFGRPDGIALTADVLQPIRTSLGKVRVEQEAVRAEMATLATSLDAQATIELAAWDSNLRIQLAHLEQVLAGDFAIVVREGVKDQVLTHIGRRSLNMLHNSLKPADAVLRQLDEKAYGAVSVGYLAFGPNIQGAVSDAFDRITASYTERVKASGAKEADAIALTTSLLDELRRAACDNLVQGTQFSMLSELVDTMIILKVDNEDPVLPAAAPPWPDAARDIGSTNGAGEMAPFTVSDTTVLSAAAETGAGAAAEEAYRAPAVTVTPAGVHMANAWMARHQLLTQKMAAAFLPPGTSTARHVPLPGIETVDETAVRQLADVATAKSVDDAARLAPSTLNTTPMGFSPYISNHVNVVTAATAVSHAAATLKVNLSVSNVNNFTPTNYNNVTPVINLSVPGEASATPSLCATADFGRAGAVCTRVGQDYVISFERPSFRGDSCIAADLEPVLTDIGKRIADYRARYGIEHDATVEGYASLPSAAHAKCPEVARDPESACSYGNKLRATVEVHGCRDALGDRNVTLSAARARNAAHILERAGGGAVIVDALAAKGTGTARMHGGPPSAHQTIMLRLRPRSAH